jgi:sulfoxide reductase heme-binding subunit YedZ
MRNGWRWSKVVVFLLGLTPLFWLGWRAWNHLHGSFSEGLSANPIEFITHFTGDWTLRLIVITLAITPFRKSLSLPNLIHYRRMLGLFAFFYGCLHFLTWIWLDKFFDLREMLEDVGKRRFITLGFAAFVAMIPLAITSTAGWIRRLGGKRWQRLHRLIYFTVIGGVIHYYWLVKSDVRKPIFYGILAVLLLAWRLHASIQRPKRTVAPPLVNKTPEPVAH